MPAEMGPKHAAHKLGNSINSIMMACGYAKMLADSGVSEKDKAEFLMALEDIQKSSEQATQLLNHLVNHINQGERL